MRKVFFLLIVAVYAMSATGQERQANTYPDSLLSRWFIEANFLGGIVNQDLQLGNVQSYYSSKNQVTNTFSGLKFNNGSSMGYEAGVGYFFGQSRHFGLGLGIIYFSQTGNVTLDNFKMEYERFDSLGNPYRQVVSSPGQIKEQITTKNLNVPLFLKYRKHFSSLFSFNLDAGVLYNLQMQNAYTTDAAFNYEAILAFDDAKKPVYDNSPTPATTDILLTEKQYMGTHNGSTAQDAATYFASLHAQGQNVGLNIVPTTKTGTVSYTSGNIGFMFRPSLGIHINDNVMVNVGGYFTYQPFKNNYDNTYHLTDKVGEYISLLSSTNSNTTTSYGGSLGIRYYFGPRKPKDSDNDGVPNKEDKCPNDSGVVSLLGCPDRDGDGIIDANDSCKDVAGTSKFNGCPDRDGDGIPDKDDACPDQPGIAKFKGCPDSDGDGIPDKDDICPFQAGPAKFKGCPDSDGDGVPDNLDKCPNIAGPIENHGCPIDTVKPVVPEPVKPVVEPKKPQTKAEKAAEAKKEAAERKAQAKKEAVEKAEADKKAAAEKAAQAKKEADEKAELAKKAAAEKAALAKKTADEKAELAKKAAADKAAQAKMSAEEKAALAKKLKAEQADKLAKEKAELADKLAKEKADKAEKAELARLAKLEKTKKVKHVDTVVKKEVPEVTKVKKHTEPKVADDNKDYDTAGAARIVPPIGFDINKTEIKEASKPLMAEAVERIKANPDTMVVIEGYTDTTGPISYNNVLSKLRAKVVKKYLINKGVNEENIISVGLATKNPIAPNTTHAGRLKNRRAEVKWGKKKKKK